MLRCLLSKVAFCSGVFQELVASYEKFTPETSFVSICPVGVLEKFHVISTGKYFLLPEIPFLSSATQDWLVNSANSEEKLSRFRTAVYHSLLQRYSRFSYEMKKRKSKHRSSFWKMQGSIASLLTGK